MEFKSLLAALVCTLPFFFSSCEKDEDIENSYEEQRTTNSKVIDVETEIKVSEDMYDLYDVVFTYEYDGMKVVEQLNKKNLVSTSALTCEDRTIFLSQKYTFNKIVRANEVNVTVSATPKANFAQIAEGMPAYKVFTFNCQADCQAKTDCYSQKQSSFKFEGIHKDDVAKMAKMGKVVICHATIK